MNESNRGGIVEGASFRDPSGFVFRNADGRLLRQVNRCYEPHYRALIESGLYEELVSQGFLVPHEEVDLAARQTDDAATVLAPAEIPFISYPYEWGFEQFRAAAVLTLEIQRRALSRGMTLKDASAYNVQFEGTKPQFIDTLSFEIHTPGQPWKAYYQFCKHFLAPLSVMAYVDPRLNDLLRTNIDGIPLDLAVHLLPSWTRFKPGLLLHLFAHARAQYRYEKRLALGHDLSTQTVKRQIRPAGLIALVDSLLNTIRRLPAPASSGHWLSYYETDAYEESARQEKERFVRDVLHTGSPNMVWDLGANTGVYSRLAADCGAYVVSMDADWACVEQNYQTCLAQKNAHVLPLRMDLTNPSPALGWESKERTSLMARGPADMALALALIHHLVIGNNLQLEQVASFLKSIARELIVEFVSQEDPQVRRLLAKRLETRPDYTRENFETAFQRHFDFNRVQHLPGNTRTLYWMRGK